MKKYMAGIIDSESYFRLARGKNTAGVDFCLSMTDRFPVDYLVKNYGASYLEEKRGINRKLIFSARLGKRNIVRFIEDFIPYLNEKYPQALLILEYMKLPKEEQKLRGEEFRLKFEKERYISYIRYFSLEYLAGIIDGDGYITLQEDSKGYLTCRLGLEQCFKELPQYLKDTYGGNLHCRSPKSVKHRESFGWSIQQEKTLILLPKIIPYLKIKKQKAKLIVDTFMKINKLKNSIREVKINSLKAIRNYE